MMKRTHISVTLAAAGLVCAISLSTRAQDAPAAYEIGTVYYSVDDSFKPLVKETAPQSGRANYSAKVKGAHATIRLRADLPHTFLVCGVDPSRFKLYRFKSEKNARTLTLMKVNVWIGGAKTVVTESEIPLAIQAGEGGCFKLTPKAVLANGEFGFSPLESMDAFMFGVGEAKD